MSRPAVTDGMVPRSWAAKPTPNMPTEATAPAAKRRSARSPSTPRPARQNPAATMTISVSRRLTAAPIAPLCNRDCVSGIRTRLIAGFSTVAPSITQVHTNCRLAAIRTWLSMMLRYMGGMQRPRSTMTGTAPA